MCSNRSRQSTGHNFNSDDDVVEEDDGASDSDHDANNLVIGEESFFDASDERNQGYVAGAGGSSGKVLKRIDSDGGRRLIRVSNNGLIVSLSSESTTPFGDDYKNGWDGGEGEAGGLAEGGMGAAMEVSAGEGVESFNARNSNNNGDHHYDVGVDDGVGPWEDGSDDTSGGWGPDGEGDGEGEGGGKWARASKDLRLEVGVGTRRLSGVFKELRLGDREGYFFSVAEGMVQRLVGTLRFSLDFLLSRMYGME